MMIPIQSATSATIHAKLTGFRDPNKGNHRFSVTFSTSRFDFSGRWRPEMIVTETSCVINTNKSPNFFQTLSPISVPYETEHSRIIILIIIV